MELRTFFWHDRIIGRRELNLRKLISARNASSFFTKGNAGDIMAENILHFFYKMPIQNIKNGENRLLCVGSIAHRISEGDLVCGIGMKSDSIPSAFDVRCNIWGLRGPVSYDLFKKKGHDLSQVKFLADPGLLLKKIIPESEIQTQPGKIIFIPHYRERFLYKDRIGKEIVLVDIDSDPFILAGKIQAAELVISSSLHGIIFAQSLNKPCVFILPQTNEPILKYIDYFESVNIPEPHPLKNISEFTSSSRVLNPLQIDEKINSIVFPRLDQLSDYGVINQASFH
jgi:pyruvyltransferase